MRELLRERASEAAATTGQCMRAKEVPEVGERKPYPKGKREEYQAHVRLGIVPALTNQTGEPITQGVLGRVLKKVLPHEWGIVRPGIALGLLSK